MTAWSHPTPPYHSSPSWCSGDGRWRWWVGTRDGEITYYLADTRRGTLSNHATLAQVFAFVAATLAIEAEASHADGPEGLAGGPEGGE